MVLQVSKKQKCNWVSEEAPQMDTWSGACFFMVPSAQLIDTGFNHSILACAWEPSQPKAKGFNGGDGKHDEGLSSSHIRRRGIIADTDVRRLQIQLVEMDFLIWHMHASAIYRLMPPGLDSERRQARTWWLELLRMQERMEFISSEALWQMDEPSSEVPSISDLHFHNISWGVFYFFLAYMYFPFFVSFTCFLIPCQPPSAHSFIQYLISPPVSPLPTLFCTCLFCSSLL